jgi:hypothetical protein
MGYFLIVFGFALSLGLIAIYVITHGQETVRSNAKIPEVTMQITKDLISALNPCKDRFENFVKFYGSKTLTKGQFMGLKNITQDDKMWVAFRMMREKSVRLCAIEIAKSVLPIFEKEYPNDLRPRKAIEAAETYLENLTEENRQKVESTYGAAYAAYAAAYAAAAYAAARAATRAATYAVNATRAATYAVNATNYATYAAAAAASTATAYAAAYAANLPNAEKSIRKIVLKHWKG